MIHPSHRPVYVTNNFYNERYVSTYTYTQQQQQQTYKESDAAKKDLKSIMEADGGDESLKKYKEQLLGAAAKGKVGSGERVVIEEFDFDFEDKSLPKQCLKLGTKEDRANADKVPVKIKQGAKYRFKVKFSVNGEIVPLLTFKNTVKSSLKNDESELVLGSFGPGKTHEFICPRYGWMEAPSGFMFRGTYNCIMQFVDGDGKKYLDVPYKINIHS